MQLTHDSFGENVYRAEPAGLPYRRFTPEIELPQRLNQAPGRTTQAPFPIGRHSGAMERLRILIVEDDATVGSLLGEMLEDLGHVICGVEADLANAVDAATHCHPDLMIVDVGLGEVRGVAAIKQILRDGSVPCVFVTDDTLRVPPRVPGAVLVRKPYRAPDIVAAIQRAMDAPAQNC